jgi:hypothetical protein
MICAKVDHIGRVGGGRSQIENRDCCEQYRGDCDPHASLPLGCRLLGVHQGVASAQPAVQTGSRPGQKILLGLLDRLRDQARPVRLVDVELGDGALDGGLGVGSLDPAEVLTFRADQRDPPLLARLAACGLAAHGSEATPASVGGTRALPQPRCGSRSLMNLNTSKAWSETDDRDLRQATTFAHDAAEIADFLCRDVEEVRERARQLGLQLPGPRELN